MLNIDLLDCLEMIDMRLGFMMVIECKNNIIFVKNGEM